MKRPSIRLSIYLPEELRDRLDEEFISSYKSGEKRSLSQIIRESLEAYFEKIDKKRE